MKMIDINVHTADRAEPRLIKIAEDATIEELMNVTKAAGAVIGELEEEILLLVENEEKLIRRIHKLSDCGIKHGHHVRFKHRHIKVLVHYMAASKPFETEAEHKTTVGQIKTSALNAFGLTEDAKKVYKLYHHKTELANLNQTIGEIAGCKKELSLKLEEVLVQGVQ